MSNRLVKHLKSVQFVFPTLDGKERATVAVDGSGFTASFNGRVTLVEHVDIVAQLFEALTVLRGPVVDIVEEEE